jgi:hypothetical protein
MIPDMHRVLTAIAVSCAFCFPAMGAEAQDTGGKASAPLFRDFVGLCGHTVQFKPELYAPVCRWVRDYHPAQWDLEGDTSRLPDWPFARNRVSWEQVYGSWSKHGLRTSACLMIDELTPDKWKRMEADAAAYAGSFAAHFGPGGKWPHVEAVEIGNEPGLIKDEDFRRLFVAAAKAIRAANSRMQIVTCNVEAGPSDRYWKGADLFRELSEFYDVLQIHRYAIAEQWPVWRRTYPENPKVPFLSSVAKLLKWRDENAPAKSVWVTEFGWDCSTRKPDPGGEWGKWVGSTDDEQARWLVRSFFCFARMGVARAFVYFFNDDDKPQLHACSGLTRHFKPKPSYHAIAWMLRHLADYRFAAVVQESLEDGYVYRFEPEKSGPAILAAWHPTRSGVAWKIPAGLGAPGRIEKMPLTEKPAAAVAADASGAIPLDEYPVLLWMTPPGKS